MMEWLQRFLRPQQSNFIELLIQQGEYTIASVEALQAYFKKQSEKKSTRARQIEKDADEVRRILVHELLDTFVTPIDREDLFALSRALDNFVDYVYSTVEELEIFDMSASEDVLEFADLLHQMANELHLAMQRLLDHPGVASEHARRVKSLENEVEDTYRRKLAALFSGPEDVHHIMEMLKTREVLRHLSNAADQGDMAADIVMDIVVKWS
jgi:predicted phosphate transport protein (TIGR00153 family)